ncbi:hypothetical protein V2J09_004697 [Rumex salicifolius]
MVSLYKNLISKKTTMKRNQTKILADTFSLVKYKIYSEFHLSSSRIT